MIQIASESRELANHTSFGEIARDMTKHRRDSYVTVENTIESDEQPFRRFYPNSQEEVD